MLGPRGCKGQFVHISLVMSGAVTESRCQDDTLGDITIKQVAPSSLLALNMGGHTVFLNNK